MQVQVNIGFEQLLEIIKDLPDAQLKQLKSAIDTKTAATQSIDLEKLLLNGPVATKEELDTIQRGLLESKNGILKDSSDIHQSARAICSE